MFIHVCVPGLLIGRNVFSYNKTYPPTLFVLSFVEVVQLSLVATLDPETHIAIGRALAPLRSEGVLIIGSGFSFHNMAAFFGGGSDALPRSQQFDDYLVEACTKHTGQERDKLLSGWRNAPHAK